MKINILLSLLIILPVSSTQADSTLTQKCFKQLLSHVSVSTTPLNTSHIEISELDLIETQTSLDTIKSYIMSNVLMNSPGAKSGIAPVIAKDSLTIRYTSNW